MKIILIIITFILATIGWFKRDAVPFYITVIVVILLVLATVVQIVSEIRDTRENEKTKYTGTLKPEPKILLSVEKNIYPELELGDGGTIFKYVGPEGKPIFKFFEDSHITISTENGQLKISAIIRNRDGVIVELIKNEWKVNPNNTFDRNYSRNALEVKDNNNEIVLQVRHVGDRIQFQGKFYDINGNGVGLVKHPSGKGGMIEKTGSSHPQLEITIEPIFRYPSELHFGELINKKT
jgi:hypothetical protein